MNPSSSLISSNIKAYLRSHETKNLLRFITCGSVDDGKSSLIGRLLFESKVIYKDQLEALKAESARFGTQGERLDLALLVDGLSAEREQGITIDVAYRFFSTERRKFIVADTPGHEQYTRNMITGASTASLAIILVDARKGVLTQTRRHSSIVNLVGIKEVVLAVNKIDLVNYDQKVFDQIVAAYVDYAHRLGIKNVCAIPISALDGDNIVQRSERTGWYTGPTLMGYLEDVQLEDSDLSSRPARFPVQWVNRTRHDFRGYSGRIAAGKVAVGDTLRVLPSGKDVTVKEICLYKKSMMEAIVDQAVTLTFEEEVDISRGDVLCDPSALPEVADHFEVNLVWMNDEPMYPGRSFLLKSGTRTVNATVTKIKYQWNINTQEKLAAESLKMNSIATCNIMTESPIVVDPYADSKAMGCFILIDRISNDTVAAGMIEYALHRSKNIVPYEFSITSELRSKAKNQVPRIYWFTGISGSGKSTIANLFEQQLHALGKHTYIIDGDNLRRGLSRDLGFAEGDRIENIRRAAEVARLMADAGLIILVTLISPFDADRKMARELLRPYDFVEIYVSTSLSVAESRDPKGLYAKARKGGVVNFTGVSSPYEPPQRPDLVIDTLKMSPDDAVEQLMRLSVSRLTS